MHSGRLAVNIDFPTLGSEKWPQGEGDSVKIRWLELWINKYDITYTNTSLWSSPLLFLILWQAGYKLSSLAVEGNSYGWPTTICSTCMGDFGDLAPWSKREKKTYEPSELIILRPIWKACSGYILFLRVMSGAEKQRILQKNILRRRKNYWRLLKDLFVGKITERQVRPVRHRSKIVPDHIRKLVYYQLLNLCSTISELNKNEVMSYELNKFLKRQSPSIFKSIEVIETTTTVCGGCESLEESQKSAGPNSMSALRENCKHFLILQNRYGIHFIFN